MMENYYAIDYQVHSLRSHDGKVSIMEMCQQAADIGLDEIGFSEHKDFDPQDPVVDYFDYDKYMREIELAQVQWGNRLTIRAGIEIDYQIWFEDTIGAYLNNHQFDFVLGSVHYVNRVKVMSDEYNSSRTAHSAYTDYFQAVRDSVMSGLFDVLAHLEYANRLGIAAWGPYDFHAHQNDLATIFDRMIDEEMALEVNTAGLFHGTDATYPCENSVALYASCGGKKISIGSDAHHPDQLGGNYVTAARIAMSCGINSVVTWDKRQAKQVELRQH